MAVSVFSYNPILGILAVLFWAFCAFSVLVVLFGLLLILLEKLGIDVNLGKLKRTWRRRRNAKKYAEVLTALSTELEEAIADQDSVLNLDAGYLMARDWKKKLQSSADLLAKVESVPPEVLEQSDIAEQSKAFLERHKDQDFLAKRNAEFKKRELKLCRGMLSDINGRSLDPQQRDAVVTDEYSNLIIAGAGSGKTLTVVGKIRYLIDRLGVKPEEILLTSFTRKSVDELASRIERAGISGVHCKTFHSIGLNQLPGVGVANENELDMCASTYLKETILGHPEQTRAYLEFYGCYKHLPKDYDEYDNAGDRFQELKATDLETIKGKLNTIKGERVKSKEELMIANYLFLHGVDYEYERNYSGEYETNGRAYQPDFYLPEYDIWLEHFGVDENGRLPWMENEIKEQAYIDGMEWKRSIHQQNETTLIESYSFWNKDQDLLNKLEALLRSNGVELSEDPERLAQIYEGLSGDDRYMRSVIRLVTTFLSLAKANNVSIEEVWGRGRSAYAGDGYMYHRFQLFMTFTEPIMKEYQQHLRDANQVDFDDMINMASESIATNGMEDRYRYIIVDEYQDISKSRFGLIQAIRSYSDAKLMCVGDDWQSIYRFAGSDVSLFTRFEEHVGYAERLKIEQTYRNSQTLVDIASDFIEKNPSQVHKKMRSKARPNDAPLSINQIDDFASSFEHALATIMKSKESYNGEILVLGRHNKDIENIYPGLQGNSRVSFWREKGSGDLRIKFCGYDKIRYLTVHRAKGLEADDVVVLNLVNSLYGFPNRLEDDPILQILLEAQEEFEFAEERRLFYVAITRTRNTVTLISCESGGSKDPSPFVHELKNSANSSHIIVCSPNNGHDEWNPTLCPSCGSGRLVVRTNPADGSQFLGCTNYPYCEETYNQIEILKDKVRCPSCGDWMVRRRRKSDGKPFFGCSNYPNCNASYDADDNYEPQAQSAQPYRASETSSQSASSKQRKKSKTTNLRCPKCGKMLVIRTNRKDGSKFYGCSSYPKCTYTRNV